MKISQREHGGYIVLSSWANYYRMWKLGIFDGCARKKVKFLKIFANTKICCKIEEKTRLRIFSGDQNALAKRLGTYQATISNMKTGSKRNMWPTVDHIKQLSEISKINLDEIKQNITHVRFGSLIILESNKELLNDVFSLRNPSSLSSQEGIVRT